MAYFFLHCMFFDTKTYKAYFWHIAAQSALDRRHQERGHSLASFQSRLNANSPCSCARCDCATSGSGAFARKRTCQAITPGSEKAPTIFLLQGAMYLQKPIDQPALKCPTLRFLQSVRVPSQVIRRRKRHGSRSGNDLAPFIDVTGNHRKLLQYYALVIDGGLNSHARRGHLPAQTIRPKRRVNQISALVCSCFLSTPNCY